MKNLSTGTGLALLAAAIVAYPFASSLAPNANAVGIGTTAVTAVAAAATAQGAPTIVWYGSEVIDGGGIFVFRAWSDGRVEGRFGTYNCLSNLWSSGCGSGGTNSHLNWWTISSPSQGLTFDADLNFDEAVNGDDLGLLLAKWGPAPRNPVPPSDCPLALINP